jgi:hypothetical protein
MDFSPTIEPVVVSPAVAVRKASLFVFYSGRTEADVMWSALCILQRELAEAGFNPR